jgi:hypothetical protein
MGRIKNKLQYPIKEIPDNNDYVIGTDSVGKETVNFRLGSLLSQTGTEGQFVPKGGYEGTGQQLSDAIPVNTTSLVNGGADGSSTYVESDELSPVASTGNYTDLNGKPTIPTQTVNTSDLINDGATGNSNYVETIQVSTVAFTGNYTDLNGQPTIPAQNTNTSQLINDGATGVSTYVEAIQLATVATSGNYSDLNGTPTIPAAVTNTSDLINDGANGSSPYATVNQVNVKDTGWAVYVDSLLTSVAPLVINQGVSSILTNNSATSVTSYLPTGVTSFYDPINNKITPKAVGDYYSFSIRFKAKNSNLNGVFDIGFDVGGALGVIFKETVIFAKGADTEQEFNIVINGFSLDTFVPNGGIPKITSIVGAMSIYTVTYQIVRIHKGS